MSNKEYQPKHRTPSKFSGETGQGKIGTVIGAVALAATGGVTGAHLAGEQYKGNMEALHGEVSALQGSLEAQLASSDTTAHLSALTTQINGLTAAVAELQDCACGDPAHHGKKESPAKPAAPKRTSYRPAKPSFEVKSVQVGENERGIQIIAGPNTTHINLDDLKNLSFGDKSVDVSGDGSQGQISGEGSVFSKQKQKEICIVKGDTISVGKGDVCNLGKTTTITDSVVGSRDVNFRSPNARIKTTEETEGITELPNGLVEIGDITAEGGKATSNNDGIGTSKSEANSSANSDAKAEGGDAKANAEGGDSDVDVKVEVDAKQIQYDVRKQTMPADEFAEWCKQNGFPVPAH